MTAAGMLFALVCKSTSVDAARCPLVVAVCCAGAWVYLPACTDDFGDVVIVGGPLT